MNTPDTKKENIRWIISFVVLTGLFYWINQTAWFQETISHRLAVLNAGATVWILSLLGMHLQQAGATVTGSIMTVEIAESCTGTLVFLIFAAAILPFPASWKSRLKGLVLGLLALLMINLFRTCLIVLVVSRFPGSLWIWHIVIGQIIVITGMIGVFLYWAKGDQEEIRFSFIRNNKTILRSLCLFAIGYLCGYQLYQLFLDSAFGWGVKELIETHTLWILSSWGELFSNTSISRASAFPPKLIEGCLSSPMVVFFVAVVFACPMKWWKRCIIILIGFIPFFYSYHLIRAVLIGLTLNFQPKEINFAYNFYGQIFLCIAGFASVAYFWCSMERSVSYKRYWVHFLLSALIAALTGLGVGWLTRHGIISFLTERIAGTPNLSYDPEQAISLTPDLQTFLWVSLIASTPGVRMGRRVLLSLLGVVVVLMGFTAGVALMETFHLTPHKGVYKLLVTSMPFAVYYFYFLSRLGLKTSDTGE